MVKVGDRIKLVYTPDRGTKLKPGDCGTVTGIATVPEEFSRHLGAEHEVNQIWVDWDTGSTLKLLDGEDRYEVIKE